MKPNINDIPRNYIDLHNEMINVLKNMKEGKVTNEDGILATNMLRGHDAVAEDWGADLDRFLDNPDHFKGYATDLVGHTLDFAYGFPYGEEEYGLDKEVYAKYIVEKSLGDGYGVISPDTISDYSKGFEKAYRQPLHFYEPLDYDVGHTVTTFQSMDSVLTEHDEYTLSNSFEARGYKPTEDLINKVGLDIRKNMEDPVMLAEINIDRELRNRGLDSEVVDQEKFQSTIPSMPRFEVAKVKADITKDINPVEPTKHVEEPDYYQIPDELAVYNWSSENKIPYERFEKMEMLISQVRNNNVHPSFEDIGNNLKYTNLRIGADTTYDSKDLIEDQDLFKEYMGNLVGDALSEYHTGDYMPSNYDYGIIATERALGDRDGNISPKVTREFIEGFGKSFRQSFDEHYTEDEMFNPYTDYEPEL